MMYPHKLFLDCESPQDILDLLSVLKHHNIIYDEKKEIEKKYYEFSEQSFQKIRVFLDSHESIKNKQTTIIKNNK